MSRYVNPALWFLATHPLIGLAGGVVGGVLIVAGAVRIRRAKAGAR